MPTTNPSLACPGLHIIAGAMGPDTWPEHARRGDGVCAHCGMHGTAGEPAPTVRDTWWERLPRLAV